jgi:hypothetical protein
LLLYLIKSKRWCNQLRQVQVGVALCITTNEERLQRSQTFKRMGQSLSLRIGAALGGSSKPVPSSIQLFTSRIKHVNSVFCVEGHSIYYSASNLGVANTLLKVQVKCLPIDAVRVAAPNSIDRA